MGSTMRDTDYATELRSSTIRFEDGSEGRIELLLVKQFDHEEIRFSWWKDGRIMMRPLDLPESDLIELLAAGIRDGVIGDGFLAKIQERLGG